MLDSVKISRRQSEIRQELTTLAAKSDPSEDELRSMESLDGEYRSNETRFRACLIAEDDERRAAKDELEARGGDEWRDLLGRFELRQVALALDEGRALDGATAEVVAEMRAKGGYRGIPVPLEALETRAGETIASGTPDPKNTMPIVDRLFPASVAGRLGGQIINIPSGDVEWPVVTSGVSASWAATETGNVGGPTAFATTDRAMSPDQNLGIQMKITRRALKQSGSALEQAVRRDMNSAIQQELDQAVFQGSGSSGQPLGVMAGASTYGITETALGAAPTWAAFRAAIVRFMTANAASSVGDARILIHPDVYNDLDGATFDSGSGLTEWDKMISRVPVGNIAISSNALTQDNGSPLSHQALLTTTAGGVAPFFVGLWGGVDMIRDPYSDAQSGGLRITGLLTADVTVARPAQLEVISGILDG